MSRGIAKFLERTSQHTSNEDSIEACSEDSHLDPNQINNNGPLSNTDTQASGSSPVEEESVLDKIRFALNQAVDLLQESLELNVGGVVLLDTAVGYSDTGNTEAYLDSTTDIGFQVKVARREEQRRSTSNESSTRPRLMPDDGQVKEWSQESTRMPGDEHKAAKVLAMSAGREEIWDPNENVLDAKTLQSLINTYPKGNVWYLDEEGFFSSLEQMHGRQETPGIGPLGRRKSTPSIDATHQKAEATMLARIFQGSRQIIFLPLWDAGGSKW